MNTIIRRAAAQIESENTMRKSLRTLPAVVLTGLIFVSPAQAELILTLSDGETTVQTSDLNTDGAVLYAGSIGDWFLNITVGVANPIIGDGNTSSLDLSSLNISGSSEDGGVLYISLTDTNNTVPFGATNYMVEYGGTSGGTVAFQSYVDTNNTAFGTETLLYDTGALDGAFSGTGFGGVSLTGPYSITTVATITHEHGFMASGFNHGVTIPEPGSLALIGIGLLGLAIGVRRSSRKGKS